MSTCLGRLEGETLAGLSMSFRSAGLNRLLSAGGISMTSVVFDNVRLAIGADIALFGNATFNNQSPTVTQLEIAHPGRTAAFTFGNITFTTVPTTGLYVSAIDANPGDGVPLVVNLQNPLPADGSTRTTVAGGASVNWGDMSLRIPTMNLGVGRSLVATVSLAQPAPAGGLVVTLGFVPGVVTVTPSTVTVPAGSSVATFNVVGVAPGGMLLQASVTGLQSAMTPLTVSANLIILGSGVVLTAGQGPQPLPVSLSTPATGFATIVLMSSNPAVATVTSTVSISTGQQGPVSATLTAVSPGVVTITATGSNLGPDVITVFVVNAAVNRTWTGAVSTDWSTAGNWSSSVVPLAGDNVTISGSAVNNRRSCRASR